MRSDPGLTPWWNPPGARHIYLSPHLDDSIYACGGLIHRQRQAGCPVVSLTLCAGTPEDGQLSSLAQSYHQAWGLEAGVMEARKKEDIVVLDRWGVVTVHWDTLDSLYRFVDGRPAYTDMRALAGEPLASEQESIPAGWFERLRTEGYWTTTNIFYAPLSIGGHVDHRLVFRLGEMLFNQGFVVWFYEDFPHSEDPDIFAAYFAQSTHKKWRSQTLLIDVEAKLLAMQGYASQTPWIFEDEPQLRLRVKAYAAERARDIHPGEKLRYWMAGSGGRRERAWRRTFGYHAHAERYWSLS